MSYYWPYYGGYSTVAYASPVRSYVSPVRTYGGYWGYGSTYWGSSVYGTAYNPWGYSTVYY